MSEQPVQGAEGYQPPSTDNSGFQSQQPPANEPPAAPYAGYLDRLPESVRPLVEPIFKEWDAGVTKQFQQVHSQYEPYKAWEPIASQYDPETTQQALALMQAIEDDPEKVYRALAESFGLGDGEQGRADPEGSNGEEFVDPRFQTVEEMTNAMAEILLQQENARREAAEDAQLDAYLNDLKTKHGDYDEDYVLAHMQLGMTGEQAIQKYQQMLTQMQAPKSLAPTVLGSGGGLPSAAIDPTKMSSKETKDLVAQMLAQANQTGG